MLHKGLALIAGSLFMRPKAECLPVASLLGSVLRADLVIVDGVQLPVFVIVVGVQLPVLVHVRITHIEDRGALEGGCH
jgi:hypothetical protein